MRLGSMQHGHRCRSLDEGCQYVSLRSRGRWQRTAVAVGTWVALLIGATLSRTRAARDRVGNAWETVVLCVGEGIAVRDRVCRAVVSDLGQGCIGVVDLLLIHGAVLAVRLAVA